MKKNDFIEMLKNISDRAMQEKKFQCALHAHKMIGEAEGFFAKKDNKTKSPMLHLKECTDEDLAELLLEMKQNNKKVAHIHDNHLHIKHQK